MQHHGAVPSDAIPSSPPTPKRSTRPRHYQFPSPTASTSRRKEKRNPSVTPRRFGRFFTPRSSLPLPLSDHRRILSSLNSSAVNRQPISPQSLFSEPLGSDPICSSPTERLHRAEDENDGGKRRWPGQSEPVIKRRRGGLFPDGMPPPPLDLQGIRDPNIPHADGSAEPMSSQESLEDRRKATLVWPSPIVLIAIELSLMRYQNHFFKASRGGIPGLQDKPVAALANISPTQSPSNSVSLPTLLPSRRRGTFTDINTDTRGI